MVYSGAWNARVEEVVEENENSCRKEEETPTNDVSCVALRVKGLFFLSLPTRSDVPQRRKNGAQKNEKGLVFSSIPV
jgi:hypothetical protein